MQKRAFSLIELSIVVIIISVLIAGIFMGSGLIKNARLSNARSHTAKSVILDTQGLISWYETTTKNSFNPGQTFDEKQLTSWLSIAPGATVGLTNKNKLTRVATSDVVYVENGINNLPSIQFTGTSSNNFKLEKFYQGSSAQNTIFFVFRPENISLKTIIDSYSGTYSVTIKDADEVTLNAGSSVDTNTITDAANFTASQNYIMAVYFDGNSSRVYINDAITVIGNSNLNVGSNELTGLTIGSNASNSNNFNGLISEVIIFNRVIKLQERKDIMNYLSTKYKISVSGL